MKDKILDAISNFAMNNFRDSSLKMFDILGYIEKSNPLDLEINSFKDFNESIVIPNNITLNESLVHSDDWDEAQFLFQLTDDIGVQAGVDKNQSIYSTIFMSLKLKGNSYTRTQLSNITRQINKCFAMPVIILFHYNNLLTLSVIHRRINKIDSNKDVLEKVTLLKDISIINPHRGHVDILNDFAFNNLNTKKAPSTFVELTKCWEDVFDTKTLNTQFYNELFKWYLWAKINVRFPSNENIYNDKYQSESLIRFITRILFVWFMKEKGLIKNELFDKNKLVTILKNSDFENSVESNYYQAIIQNLFFATLNMPIDERKWIDKNKKNLKQDGNPLYYRFEKLFISPKEVIIEIFKDIPFLNGGLFECLDDKKNGIYIDGFTKNKVHQTYFPDIYFFGKYKLVDLSRFYEDEDDKKKWSSCSVIGIIDLLDSFKFTIEENTPLEEVIALDPELLGKVFENLLASYNPETKTSARKSSGSFYTPREIVNYMVDESIFNYLNNRILDNRVYTGFGESQSNLFANEQNEGQHSMQLHESISESNFNLDSFKNDLKTLLSHTDVNPFENKPYQTKLIINAINECTILDPACGSGAYPMGILQKLVHILQKLDPDNKYWKDVQILKSKKEFQNVLESSEGSDEENKRVLEIKNNFNKNINNPDYTRKLYIIQNCIYGVDIQPIAIQISKLRFFISLLVEQEEKKDEINRGFEPLPNMDFKLVVANTLVSVPDDDRTDVNLFKGIKDVFFTNFDELTQKYFNLHRPDDKKDMKNQIISLIEAKVIEKKTNLANQIKKGNTKNLDKHNEIIELWDSYKNIFFSKTVKFFEPKYFFPKIQAGFDIVIGNPPYIKEYEGKELFDGLRSMEVYQGKMDMWYLFVEKGIKILKEKGILTYIAQNNWITSAGASKLRNYIINNSKIIELLDFRSYMIFESVSIQTMIMMFQKDSFSDNYNFLNKFINTKNPEIEDVMNLLLNESTENSMTISPKIDKAMLQGKFLIFNDIKVSSITSKIKKNSMMNRIYLGENEVANGIHPHYDFISKSINKKHSNKFILGQGIFGLSHSELEDLKLTNDEYQLIKPYYTTGELKGYYSNPKNKLWLIYTDSSFKRNNSLDNYPNLKKHLNQFTDVITSDNKPYGLHRSRDEYFFKGEKIIVQRKCPSKPIFTYTNFDAYVSATFYVIKTNRINIKYLTGLLNTKLIEFWLRYEGKMQGNNFQLDKEPLMNIPIYKPSNEEEIPIVDLVDKILKAKQDNPEADTTELEAQIDDIVYKLYNLSPAEIKIVEGA